jgi:hypothetical protein
MAEIKRLISTSRLQTEYLKTSPKHQRPLFVRYDKRFDALIILLVSPETETVVHYVDEHVGLLYKPDDFEIVGIQVEAFERSFLPEHASVNKVWRLSDSCEELEDFGDLVLVFEQRKPEVAREVARAAESMLRKPEREFVKAIEHALA